MTAAAWGRLAHAGWRWRVRAGAVPAITARTWEPPEADGPGCRIVQRWGSRVSAVCDGPEGPLFVKWYGRRHAGEALRFALFRSRPAAEWRMNAFMAEAGIPVAECLALGERRRHGLWQGGVLVLRAVIPPLTLGGHLAAAPEGEARQAAARAADLVARLHEAGFRHRDLHGENVLVERPGPVLRLVDLHEAKRAGRSAGGWLEDLARLNAYTPGSRNLRLRFWLRYAAERRLPRAHWREWLGTVENETRRLWERHRRKRGSSIERY